ncbi:MAG: DNA methyltransferase, partial [Lentisphaerae bacterium]|nr:DNA methyltransferase [Lentisphaerota bacterium]
MIHDTSNHGHINFDVPTTEGVKYTGSKLKLLPYILHITKTVKPNTILDGFSGTTRVPQAFAKLGYSVISNDISVWSEIFAKCYLKNNKPRNDYLDLIDHLNGLKPTDGWFTENYGGFANNSGSSRKDGLKKPWQIHNTRKLDAIRKEIARLNLPETE